MNQKKPYAIKKVNASCWKLYFFGQLVGSENSYTRITSRVQAFLKSLQDWDETGDSVCRFLGQDSEGNQLTLSWKEVLYEYDRRVSAEPAPKEKP